MQPFTLHRTSRPSEAMTAFERHPDARFLAGGTTLIDLMKLGIERPGALIHIDDMPGLDAVTVTSDGTLRIGALARMAGVADDARVKAGWPMIAESLWKAASPQIRNMASIGGNLLQRTRCAYFRDTAFTRCNKRVPGSGCDALEGRHREHALLGTSAHCIATHPSDLCVALVALDARVEILSPAGTRSLAFDALHLLPEATPHLEHALRPGEMITAVVVPASAAARRSLYVKVRDRQSYQFAVTSVAAGLDLAADGAIRAVRLGLGGVGTKPWRALGAERFLIGRHVDEPTALEAGRLAMHGAVARPHNAFKLTLMPRTVADALLQLAGSRVRT
ncbi:MAG: xanthine dehydrogenase family protein subunit M [Burkholderiaceae bacterium]